MDASSLRRQQLLSWKKSTGRTPMKRLSYVQDYFKPTLSIEKVPRPSGSKKVLPKQRCDVKRENVPPRTLTITPNQKVEKLTRREMLDQWLAVHGSTVKRPRSTQCPSMNKRGACTEARPKVISRISHSRPCYTKRVEKLSDKKTVFSPNTLRSLKEQFQRDIDETVAEIYENEGIVYSLSSVQDTCTKDDDECLGSDLARELDYSGSELEPGSTGTPPATHKVKSRRSISHVDSNLIFKSSSIKYSMVISEPISEPRQRIKRRKTMSDLSSEGQSGCVYLTPVRRSTRKNRQCPGLSLDEDTCFDSPGQCGCLDVRVLPNKALDFDL